MKSTGNTTEASPSKSQRKRDVEELQRLGESLIALSPVQLGEIGLPPALLDAILHAQNISRRGAQRRQRQYIGKLMRSIDPEPIQQALGLIRQHAHTVSANLHRLESLRDALIEQGDSALGRVIAKYPGTDRQQLRQLVRKAREEKSRNAPPRASRALFRYLRELVDTE